MSIYVCRFVIYDADGTRFGEIKYIIGHALGLIECSACSITHTSKGEKDEWKNLKQKCNVFIPGGRASKISLLGSIIKQ